MSSDLLLHWFFMCSPPPRLNVFARMHLELDSEKKNECHSWRNHSTWAFVLIYVWFRIQTILFIKHACNRGELFFIATVNFRTLWFRSSFHFWAKYSWCGPVLWMNDEWHQKRIINTLLYRCRYCAVRTTPSVVTFHFSIFGIALFHICRFSNLLCAVRCDSLWWLMLVLLNISSRWFCLHIFFFVSVILLIKMCANTFRLSENGHRKRIQYSHTPHAHSLASSRFCYTYNMYSLAI